MKAQAIIATVICGAAAFGAEDFFGLPTQKPKPTPNTSTTVPAIPALPGPNAAVPSGTDDLATVVRNFNQAIARQEADEARASASARAAYLKELERLRDTAKIKGQLDALLEAEAALKAAQDGTDAPAGKLLAPALAQAKTTYERARNAAIQPYLAARQRINTNYDRAIADLLVKLTRAGDVEAAKAVREARRILLTVDALVDGPSTLHIRKDGLFWVNGGNGKPGPTYIDGSRWEHRWGKPDQRRGPDKTDVRSVSLPSTDLKMGLLAARRERENQGITPRPPIEVNQRGNDLEITIPDPEAGPMWYKLVFREK